MIDFRSDTVTKPTPEMRKAMFEAVVGDDVIGEDPTVIKLEEMAAEITGKEAALFVPSGTFANLLAVFTHCNRGDEMVIHDFAHIVQHEVGGAAAVAGVQLRTVRSERTYLKWSDIDPIIRKKEDIHFPTTRLIEIQNPTGDGDIMPLEDMKEIYENSRKYNISIHLDSARIFNAGAYLNVEVKEIAKYTDSLMFCLSKGLCAPVGSLIIGTKEFIKKARKNRKLLGGGMRQVGVLAAAGIVALEKMSKRVGDDHKKAKKIAEALAQYPVFKINPDEIKTNIFYLDFNTDDSELSYKFVDLLNKEEVLVYAPRQGLVRFVTHYDVKDEEIDIFINKLPEIVSKLLIK